MNDLERACYARHLMSVEKPTSKDLKHYKYIKRERVNGKWRYYYDDKDSTKKGLKDAIKDKLGYDERERLEEADNKVRKEWSEANRALDNYHGFQSYLNDQYYRPGNIDPYTGGLKESVQKHYDEDPDREKLKELYKTYEKEHAEAQQSGHDYGKALDEFYKTPLGKIEKAKNTIEAGKKAVANLIEKLQSKKSSTRYRLFKKK